MWHVRTSVVYFYIFLCIKIYVYIFQILLVACQTLGSHCWEYRPDESSYQCYEHIQSTSLPILRYTLHIEQSLQVACENCCSYCEQSCHDFSSSRIVDSLSKGDANLKQMCVVVNLGSSARVVYLHTYVNMYNWRSSKGCESSVKIVTLQVCLAPCRLSPCLLRSTLERATSLSEASNTFTAGTQRTCFSCATRPRMPDSLARSWRS